MATLDDFARPVSETDRHAMKPDGKHGKCILCGRPVNNPGGWIEHKFDLTLIEPGSPESGGAQSQGCFPVGPECAKKKGLGPYLIPHDETAWAKVA